MQGEPTIKVGILTAPKVRVSLLQPYKCNAPEGAASGPQTFTATCDGMIEWQDKHYNMLIFTSDTGGATFEVYDVTIGVNFHWERRETQRFCGNMMLIVENGCVTLINILPVESYLTSVISSEMSASANLEFLKAHAVISRSWILAQIDKHEHKDNACDYPAFTQTSDEITRWYDRDDHVNFDVCADDHCQRYQGITRQTTLTVEQAIEATRGLVLTDNSGNLCDARFSKCCGGVFEEFENCWEPRHHHYLEARRDSENASNFPDLRKEENAREWILGMPDAFCRTTDALILGQVLNNYDQETSDFYRWTVEYSQQELAELIHNRSGIDFGEIISLEPLERGTSGRIVRLRITGTKRSMTIGKELEIRRTLSNSHLYSSAFVVETSEHDGNGTPGKFTLRGAGWGHGVGLCQIGAAVMSAQGYTYDKILSHYFPGASLTNLY